MFCSRVISLRAFASTRITRPLRVTYASFPNSSGDSEVSCGQKSDPDAQLPVVTLYTRKPCPLCDEALEKINHLSNRFRLETVDITQPGNEVWLEKYRHDIPVFHLRGEYLMKHRADPDLLLRRLEGIGGEKGGYS